QQVADVRGQAVDLPLLPVERERVVAASRVDPEGLVEPLCEGFRLVVEPVGESAVSPYLARELRHPPLRVVDVALHLDGSDRPGGEPPVREPLRVVRVLPGLNLGADARAALELDEAAAVAIAVAVDPFEAGLGGRSQAAHEGG